MSKALIFILSFFTSCCWATDSSRTFQIGLQERPFYRQKVASGDWIGVDIALIKAIFAQTPYDFVLVESPWKRILKHIEEGELDMALSAAKLPERQKYARFSEQPYRLGHNVLFVDASKEQQFTGIKRLSDLVGMDFKLGVLRGISYSDEFERLLKQPRFSSQLVVLDQSDRLPKMLLLGRIDGYLDSEYEGIGRIFSHSEYQQRVIAQSYVTTEEEAQTYLMFSRLTVTAEEVAVFDKALTAIRELGIYNRLLNRSGIQPRHTR